MLVEPVVADLCCSRINHQDASWFESRYSAPQFERCLEKTKTEGVSSDELVEERVRERTREILSEALIIGRTKLFSVSVNKNEQLIGDETNARGEVDF